jgi:hypothetical protein
MVARIPMHYELINNMGPQLTLDSVNINMHASYIRQNTCTDLIFKKKLGFYVKWFRGQISNYNIYIYIAGLVSHLGADL